MAEAKSVRPSYKPSNKVDWARFVPMMAMAFVCAAAMAWVLDAAITRGIYFVIILPILAAALTAAISGGAVRVGACRFPLVALICGFLTGVVLYLGYFYIGLLSIIGLHNAARVDLLPAYINMRMNADVTHDTNDERNEKAPDPFRNWMQFVIELTAVLGITSLLPLARSRRVYCESCKTWAQVDKVTFAPGNAKTIIGWMRSGEFSKIASLPVITVSGKQKSTLIEVESCEGGADPEECPVYFSVKSSGSRRGSGRSYLTRLALNPDEIAILGPLFAKLSKFAAPPPLQPRPTGAMAPAGPVRRIEVQDVGSMYAGQILTRGAVVVSNLLGLFPLLIIALSVGIGIVGINLSQVSHSPFPLHIVRLAIMVSCASILFVVGLIIARSSTSILYSRYYERRTRHFIALRPDRIVDPDRNNANPTYFVQVIPRRNWGKLMAENATDIGFIQIDRQKQELRFEGDKQRYRIPLSAISLCDLVPIPLANQAAPSNSAVCIAGQTSTGPWEAPFAMHETRWFASKGSKHAKARQLYDEITALIPSVDRLALSPTLSASFVSGEI